MDKDKQKRIKDRIDAMMADVGAELLDPETEKGINEEIKRIFKLTEIPYSSNGIKAFREGARLCLHMISSGGGNMADPMLLLAATQKILRETEERKKKQVESMETEVKL